MMKKKNPIYGDSLMVERNNSLFFLYPYIAVCYKHGVVPIVSARETVVSPA